MMIRDLIRRASLVGLLVLASVGTASAECAWVLWETTGDDTRTHHAPIDPYDSREECESRGARRLTLRGEAGWTVRGHLAMLKRADGSVVTQYYKCWPSTIDPRGPRGGAR